MIESITAVLFVEGDDGHAGLDASHLGHETLSGVGLVSVEDKLVAWSETGLKKTESEGGTVSLLKEDKKVIRDNDLWKRHSCSLTSSSLSDQLID